MIYFSPEDLEFVATKGGPNPPTQRMTIFNFGGGVLKWSISDNADWLSLAPESGKSKNAYYTDVVFATVDITGLEPGDYEAEISIKNNNKVEQIFYSTLTVKDEGSGGEVAPALINFENPISYNIYARPDAFSVIDLNKDGNLDIAVVASKNNKSQLIIFSGDGQGGFEKVKQYESGINSIDLATGDFNGDGITDISVANFGKIKPLTGSKYGGETGEISGYELVMFYGKGQKFKYDKEIIEDRSWPVSLHAADLNNDGTDELIVLEGNEKKLSLIEGGSYTPFDLVFYNYKKGEMEKTLITTANYSYPFVKSISDPFLVEDFDNDGYKDVLSFLSKSLFFNNQGKKNISFTKELVQGKNALISIMKTCGDFNNDGLQDIITAGSNSIPKGYIKILTGNGDGSFSVTKYLPGCLSEGLVNTYVYSGMRMFSDDLDGNGNLDFIFPLSNIEYYNEETACGDLKDKYGTWLVSAFGDGEGGFVNSPLEFHEELLGMIPMAVTGGDFNKDGKIDLAVIGNNTNKLAIFIQK